MKSFKDQSRTDWHNTGRQQAPSMEDIKVGALQRIADAAELMASNYTKLQIDLENYKRWYKETRESNDRMARRISALQGVITRMKKKAKA